MAGAATIASHGRIARASGPTVGSFGRLIRATKPGEFIGVVRRVVGLFSVCIEATDFILSEALAGNLFSLELDSVVHLDARAIPKTFIVPTAEALDPMDEFIRGTVRDPRGLFSVSISARSYVGTKTESLASESVDAGSEGRIDTQARPKSSTASDIDAPTPQEE